MVASLSAPVMSYGYPSPTPPHQNTSYDNCAGSTTGKLYHPEYRIESTVSSRTPLHHQAVNEWPPPPRAPPPTYNSGLQPYHHPGVTPPPPPVLLSHHPGESDPLGNCLCASCNSFNNNRPPDYPPSLPPAPTLPHHSSAHPQSSWHQQHSNQSYNSSPSHSSGGGVHHSDYYSSPTSANNPSFPPPHMSSAMTAHERNNNEPSMVSPSRYTGGLLMHGDSPTQHLMPTDPREWSSHDVMRWIQWASITFKLRDLRLERFQMNGKALCLMDLSMFLYRVPDGGDRLYQDFQGRLQKALCQDKLR